MKTTVLHAIETSGPGGAERMLISLVEQLDRHRYESVVCLLEDGWLNAQLRQRGIETAIIPQKRGFDVGWLISLMKFLRHRRVGLMHAQEFAMNTYCSLASTLTRTPIITTVQGKAYYAERWRRRVAYRFVSKQSRMVAVSEDIRRFLVSHVGVDERQVMTIHNGINPHVFRPGNGAGNAIRKDLGLAERDLVVGTIGNLYPVKGHVYLLQAMAAVTRRCPAAVCFIAGRGALLEPLRRTAIELGIETHVRFLGFREDVPELLRAMDVFVLPSLSEGLSLALLEAMAAGKPVVATNVGGNPEVVVDGQTGFLVPPGDPDALAARILVLLRDRHLAEHLGALARTRVDEEFSTTPMVRKYEELYGHCCGRWSQSSRQEMPETATLRPLSRGAQPEAGDWDAARRREAPRS